MADAVPEGQLEKTELGLVPAAPGCSCSTRARRPGSAATSADRTPSSRATRSSTSSASASRSSAPASVASTTASAARRTSSSSPASASSSSRARSAGSRRGTSCTARLDRTHVFVGAGDGPCAIVMVGNRVGGFEVVYAAHEVAAKYEASVPEDASSPDEAYAGFGPEERSAYRDGWLP